MTDKQEPRTPTGKRPIKYRKRPVVIEATQWHSNGDHPLDYADSGDDPKQQRNRRRYNNWEGDVVRYFRDPDVPGYSECRHCGQVMRIHGWIETLEGGHIACPGDWIITGIKGEHYPCKPDIFAATYEPIDQIGISSTPRPVKVNLTDLQDLLDRATPRPWEIDTSYSSSLQDIAIVYGTDIEGDAIPRISAASIPSSRRAHEARQTANLHLIVAAVNALPELLGEIERLRDEANEP